MILYVTKETFKRYKLKMPNEMELPSVKAISEAVIEKETGDSLMEWGGKLFYFDRRKCLQVVNFASKLTLVLVDIKVDDLSSVGNLIANYLLDIYSESKEMKKILEKHFELHPAMCFSKLTDKSIISTLNRTEMSWLDYGYKLYDYIDDGILHTVDLNKEINRQWLFCIKKGNKKEYVYGAEEFERLMKERYK